MSELCQPHWETAVQMLVCCLASHSCEVGRCILHGENPGVEEQDFTVGLSTGEFLFLCMEAKLGLPYQWLLCVRASSSFRHTLRWAHQWAASPGTAWGAALSSSSFIAQQATTGRIQPLLPCESESLRRKCAFCPIHSTLPPLITRISPGAQT